MKMPEEFTFSIKGGLPKIIITGCDLMDVVANVTYLIHYVHGRFKRMDPHLAETFRDMLIQIISNLDSPCWEDSEDIPGATEISFAVPKNKS